MRASVATRVLGGVCYIATMLEKTGEIRHMGAVDKIIVGARVDAQAELVQQVYAALAGSKGIRLLSKNIAQDFWDKWATVCTAAAMTSLMRGLVSEILQTADGRALMQQAIQETQAVAAGGAAPAVGCDRAADGRPAARSEARLGGVDGARHRTGMPRIEADGIVGDMCGGADRFGIEAPMLRAAFVALQFTRCNDGRSCRVEVCRDRFGLEGRLRSRLRGVLRLDLAEAGSR